jgi:hypothetical protein
VAGLVLRGVPGTEVTVNTKPGVELCFVALGGLERPSGWNVENLEELTLDLKTATSYTPSVRIQ